MRLNSRHLAVTGLMMLSLAVMGAAIAWACSPSAAITLSESSADQGGNSVTVEGSAFVSDKAPEGVPVEIRWNTADGETLAEARANTRGTFSVAVTVPRTAQRDTHQVVAVAYDAEKTEVIRVTTASYTIGAGPTSQPETTRGETSGETSGGEPRSRGEARDTASSTSGAESGSRGASRSTRTAAAGRQRLVARAAPARPAPKATTQPATVVPNTTAAVPDASTVAAVRSRPPSRRAPATAAKSRRKPAAVPSSRSASGDLWSGVARGPAVGLREPALATPASGPGALVIGVALLGVGMIGLVGGFGIVAVRRRRLITASQEDR